MDEQVVKLKVNRRVLPPFTLRGGSDYGEFIQVDRLRSWHCVGRVYRGDLIVSINGVNIVGYTQADAENLLKDMCVKSKAGEDYLTLVVWSPLYCNKTLRSLLYSSFHRGSLDSNVRTEAILNLSRYQPIVTTDITRAVYGGQLYQYVSIPKLEYLRCNERLIYLCLENTVYYGLLYPKMGANMCDSITRRVDANRDKLIADISYFKAHVDLEDELPSDISLANLVRVLYSASYGVNGFSSKNPPKERVLITKYSIKLRPKDQKYGFQLQGCKDDIDLCLILNDRNTFKAHLMISSIGNVETTPKLKRLRLRDVLYSADHYNIHNNDEKEILRYIKQQASLGKPIRFVFIRVRFYIQKKIHNFPFSGVKTCEYIESDGDTLIASCRSIRNEMKKRQNCDLVGFAPGGFSALSQKSCQDLKVATKNKHVVVESVNCNSDNTCQQPQPGDIIYSINGVNMMNKNIDYVRDHIENCKNDAGCVDLVVLSKMTKSEYLVARKKSNYSNKKAALQSISNRLDIHQKTKVSKAQYNPSRCNKRSSSSPTSDTVLSVTNFVVKAMLYKKTLQNYGLVISKNQLSEFVVDGLVSNGVAYNSQKIDEGDVILAVNDIPTRKLTFKNLKKLIDRSQESLQLNLYKRPTNSDECPSIIV